MQPEISVVIPSHNRVELLRGCLLGLREQWSDSKFEVVVVLDGCTDDSAEQVGKPALPFRLTVIEQAQAGPAAARNRGLERATAPLALFIDDDITLVPGAIRAHIDAQEKRGGIVIGPIETVATHRGLPARSVAFWRARQRRHDAGGLLTFLDCFTGNMSVPVSAVCGEGGFDESLRRSEDIELAFRLVAAGLEIGYAAAAGAVQTYTKTTRECLEDAEGFGRASIALWKLHPGMRKYLYFGGVTPGVGIQSRLLPSLARAPLPTGLFSLPGAVPSGVPAMRWFGDKAQAYMRARGARREAGPELWRKLAAKLRILRYAVPEGSAQPPEEFRAQMAWLATRRERVLTLKGYLERMEAGVAPTGAPVVVTVDANQAQNLDPWTEVLKEHGLPATVFVGNDGLQAESGRLRGLTEAGFEIGVLNGPSDAAADPFVEALRAARLEVEAATGAAPSSVAFAAAPLPPAFSAAAAKAGFEVACSGAAGPTGWRTDPYNVPRTRIEPGISLRRFQTLVRFGTVPAGVRFL